MFHKPVDTLDTLDDAPTGKKVSENFLITSRWIPGQRGSKMAGFLLAPWNHALFKGQTS